MINDGKQKLGRFSVDVEIVNNQDLALAKAKVIEPAKIRRKTIKGVVDCGAARLVLPAAVAKELGLPVRKDKVRVGYADGRKAMRTEVEEARLFLQGRDGVFKATIEAKRDTALIGALVLEDLDFLVDSLKMRLIPRDPNFVFAEIE